MDFRLRGSDVMTMWKSVCGLASEVAGRLAREECHIPRGHTFFDRDLREQTPPIALRLVSEDLAGVTGVVDRRMGILFVDWQKGGVGLGRIRISGSLPIISSTISRVGREHRLSAAEMKKTS